MPLVKIRLGLSHGYRAADGSHAYHQAGAEFNASPAEMESFGDKFLLITAEVQSEPRPPGLLMQPVQPVPLVEINATKGAIRLAQEHGISLTLSDIVGTGTGGRIIKADVKAFLDNEAEASMEASLDVYTEAPSNSGGGTSLNGDDVEALLTGDDLKALLNGDAK